MKKYLLFIIFTTITQPCLGEFITKTQAKSKRIAVLLSTYDAAINSKYSQDVVDNIWQELEHEIASATLSALSTDYLEHTPLWWAHFYNVAEAISLITHRQAYLSQSVPRDDIMEIASFYCLDFDHRIENEMQILPLNPLLH